MQQQQIKSYLAVILADVAAAAGAVAAAVTLADVVLGHKVVMKVTGSNLQL